ncbi:MAG: cache domain-containing protein, partial [Deltaproteobacteria bacterium]|nr:cache domain-containing protein [Deltaproteobacteria bacterium]
MRSLAPFKTIHGMLTFWLFLAAFLPLLTFSAILIEQRTRFIKEEAFHKLEAIRDLKVESVNDWFNDTIIHLKAAASDETAHLIETVLANDQDDETLNHLRDVLKSFLALRTQFTEIMVLHPVSGKVLTSTNPAHEREFRGNTSIFSEVSRQRDIFIQDIHYSTLVHGLRMSLAAPVFKDKEMGREMIGIMVADVRLEELNEVLQNRTGLGTTGETLIVNQDVLAVNQLRWHGNAP